MNAIRTTKNGGGGGGGGGGQRRENPKLSMYTCLLQRILHIS